MAVIVLAGCSAVLSEPLYTVAPAVDVRPPTPAPTVTPTVQPTITPLPTLTPYPSPLPTIVIPMLTRTAPMTVTPAAGPVLWQLPDPVIPEPFGAEIHFTRASREELDYIAAGGFRWIRMDMFWHSIETAPASYNFGEYDVLVKSMVSRGIRIVFILDYGNPLYDNGYPPTSPEAQAAYARFAAAAARRYRDDGVIWELWNEPNIDHFWPPEANASQYGQLALKAIAAIRRADPTAIIVAPALSGYDWPFLRTLAEMGLFQQIDAVTIHSYGVRSPEAIVQPYLELRALINRYSPSWKIPILSGEWGFYTSAGGYSEGQQAQYLSRQWLVNLSNDMSLTIWYDWRDDGPDIEDPEQNFGTVHNDYSAKPSYLAARTIATTLSGYRFLRRIPLELHDDYLLLFQNGASVAMALWTTEEAHTIILPISVDDVAVVGMTGDEGVVPSEGEGLAVPISQSPRYLVFRPDQAATYLGGWRPIDTVNCLTRDGNPAVPVIFDDANGFSTYGDLQVWAGNELRGRLQVSVLPMVAQRIAVPVDIEGLSGDVPAELRFVRDDGPAMASLQTASIWLQVSEP